MASAEMEEKEKVYLFVDWANLYREGRALHWERYCPIFERLEGCVPVKDIDKLSDQEQEWYKEELEIIKKQNKQKVYLSTYYVKPEWLKSICSRCKVHGEEPPKEQCFAFVSHPPGVSIENRPVIEELNQCFVVEYHERVGWSEKKEKEKGVDVALAIQIMTTIYEKDEANLRIVVISGDSDFQPVIKKLMGSKNTGKLATKNISVEVWGWMSSISEGYESYLQNLEKESSRKILYHLDEYMYQIGYAYYLEHRWCMKLTLPKNADGYLCKWYEKLSHFTLVNHLQSSTSFGLQTTDFVIRREDKFIFIKFLTIEARNKFKKFLELSRNNYYYYYKLNQKEYDSPQQNQKMKNASDAEDDDGINFQNEE